MGIRRLCRKLVMYLLKVGHLRGGGYIVVVDLRLAVSERVNYHGGHVRKVKLQLARALDHAQKRIFLIYFITAVAKLFLKAFYALFTLGADIFLIIHYACAVDLDRAQIALDAVKKIGIPVAGVPIGIGGVRRFIDGMHRAGGVLGNFDLRSAHERDGQRSFRLLVPAARLYGALGAVFIHPADEHAADVDVGKVGCAFCDHVSRSSHCAAEQQQDARDDAQRYFHSAAAVVLCGAA